MKKLTKEQKEYIRDADNAILFLEDQIGQMGIYDEEKQEQEKSIETIKDFICWGLNNIRVEPADNNEIIVNRADLCELAHELTAKECERLGLILEYPEEATEKVGEYTKRAQEIFDAYIEIIDNNIK